MSPQGPFISCLWAVMDSMTSRPTPPAEEGCMMWLKSSGRLLNGPCGEVVWSNTVSNVLCSEAIKSFILKQDFQRLKKKMVWHYHSLISFDSDWCDLLLQLYFLHTLLRALKMSHYQTVMVSISPTLYAPFRPLHCLWVNPIICFAWWWLGAMPWLL